MQIFRSDDDGKTFGCPTVLLWGGGGKPNGTHQQQGVHKNPQPVVEFGGRIWSTLEWGSWTCTYKHAAMVMSAPVGSNLLDPESWEFSEPVKYDPHWEGLPSGFSAGTIEGCLVAHQGELFNIMRYHMAQQKPNYGKALVYKVNTDDPGAPLKFIRCMDFPANHSKFIIKYHEGTRRYYTLASRILNEENSGARNLLSLMSSADLVHWDVVKDVIDMRHEDRSKFGFQYVDFFFEGDEILYLSRTAMNGAHNFHDSNYSTFGRISIKEKLK